MNTFPRNSNHLGHLISALNQHYCCAEDGGTLIYACGSATETLTCFNDSAHQGLAENKEWTARDRMGGASGLFHFSIDPRDELLRRAVKIRNQRINVALYGDEE